MVTLRDLISALQQTADNHPELLDKEVAFWLRTDEKEDDTLLLGGSTFEIGNMSLYLNPTGEDDEPDQRLMYSRTIIGMMDLKLDEEDLNERKPCEP